MGSFLKQPLFFLGWPAQASHWITFHLSTTFPLGRCDFMPPQKPRRHFAPECFFFFFRKFHVFILDFLLFTISWVPLKVEMTQTLVTLEPAKILQPPPFWWSFSHSKGGFSKCIFFRVMLFFANLMNNGEPEKTNVLLDGWKLQKFEDVKICSLCGWWPEGRWGHRCKKRKSALLPKRFSSDGSTLHKLWLGWWTGHVELEFLVKPLNHKLEIGDLNKSVIRNTSVSYL